MRINKAELFASNLRQEYKYPNIQQLKIALSKLETNAMLL